ncbi:hypothetical protein NNG48_12790, partial [Enterococcus faecium]|nr:hypothetical protein [Enterococcus faecium]
LIVIPPAIFFYYSTLSDSRFKTLQQNPYLIGKLINILGTDEDTELFLSSLSMIFTDKHFSTRFGGEELVEIFQSMRPALIKLYREKTPDEFYDWFEK